MIFGSDVKKMAQAERIVFNRYGYDRIHDRTESRGIVEALGGKFIYPENGVPYADVPMISDYKSLMRWSRSRQSEILESQYL